MEQMIWKLCTIDNYLDDINKLFIENKDHKHSANYLKYPLFKHTKFARMGWDKNKLVYYSAAASRPEYKGSIRVMTRHTRSRFYNFGSRKEDLNRGTETLDLLTSKALDLGYKDIWFSREESNAILKIMNKRSMYDWSINWEHVPATRMSQWILRLNY